MNSSGGNIIITYFHRNLKAGYSINKVTQTIVSTIPNKREFYVPCVRIYGVLRNIWYVYKHRDKGGINHITGDIHYCILALIGCKSVLTVHDLVAIDYNGKSWIYKTFNKWFQFVLPLKFATKVVCISEETKRRVLKYTKRTDIEVIHNAVDPAIPTVLKNQSNNPYRVLVVGTRANKNLERTILALKGVECELTIIGRLSNKQLVFLDDCGIKYVNRENLSDQEIIDEYVNCDIVSFISLYEGFGMPIIEANKVGRPVITSDIPVLREVAGDSALFVNPMDVNDIHKGFLRLFEDSDLRETCVKKGLENVKRFVCSHIREEWMELYSEILRV